MMMSQKGFLVAAGLVLAIASVVLVVNFSCAEDTCAEDTYEYIQPPLRMDSPYFSTSPSITDVEEPIQVGDLFYILRNTSHYSGYDGSAKLVSMGAATGQTIYVPDHINYDGKNYIVDSVGLQLKNISWDPAMNTLSDYLGHVGFTTNLDNQTGINYHQTGRNLDPFPASYSLVFEGPVAICDYAFCEFDVVASYYRDDLGHSSFGLKYWVRNSGLSSVEFRQGVTEIGKMAFAYTNITGLDIGVETNAVGEYAFEYCGMLESIDWQTNANVPKYAFFDSSLVSINIEGAPESIGDYAFSNTKLTSIAIPDSVNMVGTGTFRFSLLKTVQWGSSVTKVPDTCFQNTPLETITFKEPITEVGTGAFSHTNLSSVDLSNVTVLNSFAFYNSLKSDSVITLDLRNVSCVPDNAFAYAEADLELILSSGLESIGNSAFENVSISSLSIPDGTHVGQKAFRGATIRNVSLGADVILEDNVFNASIISEVVITDGVSVGNRCFSQSTLSSVTISESCKLEGNSIFYNCKNLRTITFEGSRNYIGNWFVECTSLTEVIFPNNLKMIDDSFEGCSNFDISSLYFDLTEEEVLSWNINSFLNTSSTVRYSLFEDMMPGYVDYLKINLGTSDNYHTRLFMVSIKGVENVLNLDTPNEYYYELPINLGGIYEKLLTEALFPKIHSNNISYQDYDGALYSGDGFTLLKVPYYQEYLAFMDNVETIGPGAFRNSNIVAIEIPATITVIGKSAFDNSKLTSLTLNEGLERVEDFAFLNLPKDKPLTVIIPDSLEYIGNQAFDNVIPLLSENSSLKHIGDRGLVVAPGEAVYLPDNLEEFGDLPLGDKLGKIYLSSSAMNINVPLLFFKEGSNKPNQAYGVKFYVTAGIDKNIITDYLGLFGGSEGEFGGYFINKSGNCVEVSSMIKIGKNTIYLYSEVGAVEILDSSVTGDGCIITISVGDWTAGDLVVKVGDKILSSLGTNDPTILKYEVPIYGSPLVVISEKVCEISHTITFCKNNGEDNICLVVGDGRSVQLDNIPLPSKNRSVFVGWYDLDGNAFNRFSPVVSDLTLVAVWDSANPRILFDENVLSVKCNGHPISNGDRVSVTDGLEIVYLGRDGYYFKEIVVSSQNTNHTYVETVVRISGITDDTVISVEEGYYNLSDSLRYINDVIFETDNGSLYLQWMTNYSVDMSMTTWRGGTSVPLVVDGKLYSRSYDTLHMYNLETGRLLRTVDSKDQSAFYHYVGYANGHIIDYRTSRVYDTNLDYEFTLERICNKIISDESGIYAVGGGITKYSPDFKSILWSYTTDEGCYGYINWGVPGSVIIYGDYLYWVGLSSGIPVLQSVNKNTGGDRHTFVLTDFSGFMLDDGWLSVYNDTAYLTIYSSGLFGDNSGVEGGGIIAIPVNNGAFIEENMRYYDGLWTKAASEFIVYDGRGYVLAGGTFFVFDVEGTNLNLCYKYSDSSLYSHGGITINISDEYVEIFFIPYSSTSYIGMFRDTPGQLSCSYKRISVEIPPQYNTQCIRFTDDGKVYFYNDLGNVYVLGPNKIDHNLVIVRNGSTINTHILEEDVIDYISGFSKEGLYFYMLGRTGDDRILDYDESLVANYQVYLITDVEVDGNVLPYDELWYSEEFGIMSISDIRQASQFMGEIQFDLVEGGQCEYVVYYSDPWGNQIGESHKCSSYIGATIVISKQVQEIDGYKYSYASKGTFRVTPNISDNVVTLYYIPIILGDESEVQGSIVVDFTIEGNDGNNVIRVLDALANTKRSVEIRTNEGIIELDAPAVMTVAASGYSASVFFSRIDNTILNGINSLPEGATIYDITITVGNLTIHEFGGVIKITIPLDDQQNNLGVWYIDDDGEIHEIDDVIIADGTLSFCVDHLSYFAVTQKDGDFSRITNESNDILYCGIAVVGAIVLFVILGVILRRRRIY